MISVEEAKELIVSSTKPLPPVGQLISKSVFQVLSEDIHSPIPFPPFHQSTMDGFAILYSDFLEQKEIEIVGEAPAGNPFKQKVSSGQAVRIFTGSKIPEGADTVVVQEKVSVEKGKLIIQDAGLAYEANVRKKGSQTKEGDIALRSGIMLTPAAIGLLAGLGLTSANIFPAPRVSIVVTGNELQTPSKPLADGQVYESNSLALRAALALMNIPSATVVAIGDDEKLTTKSLEIAVTNSDIVLISGGISVGKYDYVNKAMQKAGVQNIFYKVFQKPGKPLFFGKHNTCLLFGLPGNPAAALTCFYEYTYPALRIMQGFSSIFLKQIQLPVFSGFQKNTGLSLFLKGKISDRKVEVLDGQESNNIASLAYADCLVYLPAEKTSIKSGEAVEVHLLPWCDFPV